MITAEHILNEIVSSQGLPEVYLDVKKYPLPKAYCPPDKNRIKALVLGADPSNFCGDNMTIKINVVFGIGEDSKYFNCIHQNLQQIGLTLDDVYVQNVVRNYMYREARSNPYWGQFAEGWFPYLEEEFEMIDPYKKMPVFVTDEKALKFLLHNPYDIGIPGEYYSGARFIPVLPEDNKLERNLIPLYRHPAYQLDKQEYYKNKIIDLLSVAMD